MSSSTTPKGLHRGYSCPSLVPSNPSPPPPHPPSKPTIQHSLSVSLSSCQQPPSMTTPPNHHHSLQQGERIQTHYPKKEQDTTNISPLTEINLKEHTIKTAYGRESRHRRVKCYVDSQIQLLRLEAELERRRRMEIRSLVPLDTHSYDQDVILLSNDDSDDIEAEDEDEENDHHHPVYHNDSNHDFLDTTSPSPTTESQRRKKSLPSSNNKRGNSSLRFVKRWFSLYKKTSTTSLKQPPPPPLTEVTGGGGDTHAMKKKKRHTISFEQYQQDKANLIGQGLHGLSNQNIARALGAGGLASVVFSPPPSPVTLMTSTSTFQPHPSSPQHGSGHHHNNNDSQITSTSTSAIHHHHQHQKRDSGVSLFSKSTSKKESLHDPHHMSRSNSFVSARYPKMIHLKTLRGAAIQALSSDFSLGEESMYCCSTDLPTTSNCCSCPR